MLVTLHCPPDEAVVKEMLENSINRSRTPQSTVFELPQSGRQLSDNTVPSIMTMAFPVLFPYGKGDVTCKDRYIDITMTEANAHLLKYYTLVDTPNEKENIYPFAHHPTWMHWAQNTAERHRYNTQKSV